MDGFAFKKLNLFYKGVDIYLKPMVKTFSSLDQMVDIQYLVMCNLFCD